MSRMRDLPKKKSEIRSCSLAGADLSPGFVWPGESHGHVEP